jgi:hypothetical protein
VRGSYTTRSLWFLVVGVLALLPEATALADVIHDQKLGFAMTLPEGFADYPPGREVPNTRYAFIKGVAGSDDFVIVGIEPMGGTIGREPLKASDIPATPGTTFELRREKWKSFEIDVMSGVARGDEGSVFLLVAQVPLEREAIQLKLVGPEAKGGEMIILLRALLGSLDGRSNWLTDQERSRRLGKAAVWLMLALAMGGWAIWRWRRRRGRFRKE